MWFLGCFLYVLRKLIIERIFIILRVQEFVTCLIIFWVIKISRSSLKYQLELIHMSSLDRTFFLVYEMPRLYKIYYSHFFPSETLMKVLLRDFSQVSCLVYYLSVAATKYYQNHSSLERKISPKTNLGQFIHL